MKTNADRVGKRTPSETSRNYGIPSANSSGKLSSGWGGAASSLATLDGSSLVVQNPANATATPTASKIPIADGSGTLNSWITQPYQPFLDYTVPSAVTSVTMSSLDGNAHGGYWVEFVIENTSGSVKTYSIYVEGDTTATNYQSHRVGAANQNNAVMHFDTVNSGARIAFSGRIDISPTGWFNYVGIAHLSQGVIDSHAVHKVATISNITRIDVVSGADGIGINSRFRIWRKM